MKNKIMRNRKAGIAPLAIIVVAIIIVAGIALYVSTTTDSNPYWETETDFGMWQDEITIEFEDGTTKSFKLIGEEGDVPFTVYYGNKAISKVSMSLTGKATGSGYTGAEVKCSSLGYDVKVKKGSSVLYSSTGPDRYSGTKKITLGSTEKFVGNSLYMLYFDNNPSKYPDGTYTVNFYPEGSAKYRGYPDGGDWTSVSLPPNRSITIKIQRAPTGSILVTLYSTVTTT